MLAVGDPLEEHVDAARAGSRLGTHPEFINRLTCSDEIPAKMVPIKGFILCHPLE